VTTSGGELTVTGDGVGHHNMRLVCGHGRSVKVEGHRNGLIALLPADLVIAVLINGQAGGHTGLFGITHGTGGHQHVFGIKHRTTGTHRGT